MNQTEIRNLQTPLKEKYRQRPESALLTLRAEGRMGEGVTCSVQTGRAIVEAGLHPATGGSGGIFGDLSSMASQLGAGQAIDLLKGMVMPAIMSAVKPPGAPAAAAALPAAAPAIPGL